MTTSTVEFGVAQQAAGSATPNFDRLAPIYRWMEWLTFGPFLQRCRCAFLSLLARRRRALVVGDGDGRFTARLVQANAEISVDAVDASEAMLRQLAYRSRAGRIQTCVADARTFTPGPRDYDMIATHFFLDCLSEAEVRNFASRLRNHAAPDAIWVISEFAIPANFYGRAVARPLISALYLAFGVLTRLEVRRLPNHHIALSQSGWSLLHERRWLAGLLVSEVWQLDRDS